MNKANRRGGPRSLLRRGPKAAHAQHQRGAPSRAVKHRRLPAPGDPESVDDADRRLRNYREIFNLRTANEAYFRATRAIVTAARRWRKLANERVKVVGQTMARWETLFLVALSGDELTQGELARLISVEGPTIVRMLDVLGKEGLIARRQNSADRRVTTNRITPKGLRAIREIMDITDHLRAEVMGNIDPRRLEVFLDVLTQILRGIDEKSGAGLEGKACRFERSLKAGARGNAARRPPRGRKEIDGG
jgi:MarR family transcriptional regulator for hemolysin